jgi:hypothetical protein
MIIMKRYKGMALAVLCAGLLAGGNAVAANGYPPGAWSSPAASWGHYPGWHGYPGAGLNDPRYISQEEQALREWIRADREAIGARHRWRETNRSRRDTPWGMAPGWRGAPGPGYRQW